MNIKEAAARYDEISRELEELAGRWESADHGGMTRQEYAAMRRADAEAQRVRLAGPRGLFG